MPAQHPKREYLTAVGALHPHPERVRATIFTHHRFFDALDKVQVKYEMLRAHAVDGRTVVAVAAEFGCSRETFYTAQRALAVTGISGLRDNPRGRCGPRKFSPESIEWIRALACEQPDLTYSQLAQALSEEYGVSVHARTIQRVLFTVPKPDALDSPVRQITLATGEGLAASRADFLTLAGPAQQRYEALRESVLLPDSQRSRTNPIRFDLARFERFGLLGLLEHDPAGGAWHTSTSGPFRVEVIPVGTACAPERASRLYALLYDLVTAEQGDEHDHGRSLRPSFDRHAGEGAHDSEPARRHFAVR